LIIIHTSIYFTIAGGLWPTSRIIALALTFNFKYFYTLCKLIF